MEPNDSSWVDRRMDSLEPSPAWQPDTEAALLRYRQLHRRAAAVRRRAIVGGFAVIAACLILFAWRPKPASTASTTAVAITGPHVTPAKVEISFREAGSITAPILAEIYSDYQCGSCAELFRDTVPGLVADYVQTGKVRLLHRDLPLPQHPYARAAARYANAAGRSGYYDTAVRQLFRTQTRWSADGDIESRLAEAIPPAGMDRVRGVLLNSAAIDAAIDSDIESARIENVASTPAMIVTANGRRRTLMPVPAYPALRAYLDGLLKANCREDPHAARC